LNFEHLRRHGIPECRITFARFSVPDPFGKLHQAEMDALRRAVRKELQIGDERVAVSFFGKFIAKKSPTLVFVAMRFLPEHVRSRLHLVFVGSGDLQDALVTLAQSVASEFGVQTSFAGFVNQSRLPGYYLASDIVILPSSFEETWGLVVNEALNAGCGVIVTKVVGCQTEFAALERVRVVQTGSAEQIATSIGELIPYPRSYGWARSHMLQYSTEAAAGSIAAGITPFFA
jgi:glycosyltransferase involved in cell wall biosynthesis